MSAQPTPAAQTSDLRARAEARVRARRKGRGPASDFDSQRTLHELQVHQVELEMQNAELQDARNRLEAVVAKYTDLYDFAPVGYMSLDEQGRIMEVNLTGAALLGEGRSRLISRRLPSFLAPANRANFLGFLQQIFTGPQKQACEAAILRPDGSSFWANFHGAGAPSFDGQPKACRVAVSDISALKRSEETQRRVEALAVANRELKQEIARRETVEKSLKKSEQHTNRLLAQSNLMQEQLQYLSRQVLQAQEEERKRISRELHDVIAQTLTGISVSLATLKKGPRFNAQRFEHAITRTQELVEASVKVVHQFARNLRPAALDDLGLIPALHAYMKFFAARTGLRTHLTAFAEVEQLDTAQRTVLFRVAQEALTNVERHAGASKVEVSILKMPRAVCMKVQDDGKSFSVESVLHRKGGRRLGLLGMRERLEMIGGSFEIESAAGEGTTVIAQIPPGKETPTGQKPASAAAQTGSARL